MMNNEEVVMVDVNVCQGENAGSTGSRVGTNETSNETLSSEHIQKTVSIDVEKSHVILASAEVTTPSPTSPTVAFIDHYQLLSSPLKSDPESDFSQTSLYIPSHLANASHEITLQSLPRELQERIFIFAGTGALALTCRAFRIAARSNLTRARWLMATYGPRGALAHCWAWKFMKRAVVYEEGRPEDVKETASNHGSVASKSLVGALASLFKHKDEILETVKGEGGVETCRIVRKCKCAVVAARAEELMDTAANDHVLRILGSTDMDIAAGKRPRLPLMIRLKKGFRDLWGELNDPVEATAAEGNGTTGPTPLRAFSAMSLSPNNGAPQTSRPQRAKSSASIKLLGASKEEPIEENYDLENRPWMLVTCPIERVQMEICSRLLEMGTFVRGGGDMALREAARWGHLQLAEFLLLRGANPDAVVALKTPSTNITARSPTANGGSSPARNPAISGAPPPNQQNGPAANAPVNNALPNNAPQNAVNVQPAPANPPGALQQQQQQRPQQQPQRPRAPSRSASFIQEVSIEVRRMLGRVPIGGGNVLTSQALLELDQEEEEAHAEYVRQTQARRAAMIGRALVIAGVPHVQAVVGNPPQGIINPQAQLPAVGVPAAPILAVGAPATPQQPPVQVPPPAPLASVAEDPATVAGPSNSPTNQNRRHASAQPQIPQPIRPRTTSLQPNSTPTNTQQPPQQRPVVQQQQPPQTTVQPQGVTAVQAPPPPAPLQIHIPPNLPPGPLLFPMPAGVGVGPQVIMVPRDPLIRPPRPLKVSLLLQAVQLNHVRLVEVLVSPNVTSNVGGVPGSPRRFRLPAEMAAVAESPETPQGADAAASPPIPRVSQKTLKEALREAFFKNRIRICQLLIEKGGAIPTGDMVQDLLMRASTLRMTFGIRERLTPLLVLAIKYLNREDFNRLNSYITRTTAEVGSPYALLEALRRGGDVNTWEGHPLYCSIYNGNLEITKFLLNPEIYHKTSIPPPDEGAPAPRGANLRLFTTKQKLFCIGLIGMEAFAILMYILLMSIWILGIVQVLTNGTLLASLSMTSQNSTVDGGPTPTSTQQANIVTVGELTGMAIPSTVALCVMYRLVPFHRLIIGYHITCKEQRKRKRADARRQANAGGVAG